MIGGEDITRNSMSGGVGPEQPLLGCTQYIRTVGMLVRIHTLLPPVRKASTRVLLSLSSGWSSIKNDV